MLIYLAGPLFSEAERRFNLGLTQRLEALSLHVFLPQRDGVERDKPPYDTMAPEERRHVLSTSTGPGSLTQTCFCSCSTDAFLTREHAWS